MGALADNELAHALVMALDALRLVDHRYRLLLSQRAFFPDHLDEVALDRTRIALDRGGAALDVAFAPATPPERVDGHFQTERMLKRGTRGE